MRIEVFIYSFLVYSLKKYSYRIRWFVSNAFIRVKFVYSFIRLVFVDSFFFIKCVYLLIYYLFPIKIFMFVSNSFNSSFKSNFSMICIFFVYSSNYSLIRFTCPIRSGYTYSQKKWLFDVTSFWNSLALSKTGGGLWRHEWNREISCFSWVHYCYHVSATGFERKDPSKQGD